MAETKFVGGHPCLDFVNTVGGRVLHTDTVLREKLTDYRTLAAWTQRAGFLSVPEFRQLERAARRNPQRAARTLARAVRLREALYRIFSSLLERRPPRKADIDALSKELASARSRERLIASASGFVWAWDHAEDTLDLPLWCVSQSAADLLTSADLGRLRRCGGHQCGWLFLDTSRNRKRRWCDMKDCGNRAKVRSFRERHK